MVRIPEMPPLLRLPDGTVKQVNPLTGTQVWTVPGRGNRPLVADVGPHRRICVRDLGRHCAFCEKRYLDTTPEKARLVRDGEEWRTISGLSAEELDETVAEFRLIPNLFEIVSLDYWKLNHGWEPPESVIERRDAYLSTVGGLTHVEELIDVRAAASGQPYAQAAKSVDSFFGGFHDVVVARRHFVDGARCEDELCSSGMLTAEEHFRYVAFTVDALARMYAANPLAVNVAVFQNWLRPAGASFDHLHKQLVAMDTLGRRNELELLRLGRDPALYQRISRDLVAEHDLVVASNEHAVAFAGIGHRYPSLEVWMRDTDARPWSLPEESLRGWSDLLHACHAATGPLVACNEEWHYRPPSLDEAMPLRAVLKWRISTLAGFEGGTDININTLDPWAVRDRARAALAPLAEDGLLAGGVVLA